MDFSLSTEDKELVSRIRDYLDAIPDRDMHAARSFDITDMSEASYDFRRMLGRDGWLGLSWPPEYGGMGATALQEWLVSEELASRRLPLPGLSVTSLGPTLIRIGTEQQKREFLTGIRDGSKLVALGYTEPGAGTDLAALQTRAVRVDDTFVVNGQKLFTSGAHAATHIWTAVRTDPDAPKREGISILIISTEQEGVTISGMTTQAGERTNQVYFDDVVVSDEYLVGEENLGWQVVRLALDYERTSLIPASALLRDWEELAELIKVKHAQGGGGQSSLTDAEVHADLQALGKLRVDVEIARLFFLRIAWLVGQGKVPHAEASMAKVWSSELRMRMSAVALDIIGPDLRLSDDPVHAQAIADFAWLYMFSSAKRFGGGTNEVQRQLSARARLQEMGLVQ